MKTIEKHPLIVIILLYTLANIFMLLNNGWYWDDWCISSPEGLRDISTGVGATFMIPISSWLINLTTMPALLYHITTGVIEILGIVIFYKSLSLLGLNRSHTFLITLFFALLPYNLAKMSMACFMYTIGLLFFLLAVLLFIYFIRKNNLIERIISLIFFFCSFLFLPSTLVLALAFFLLMAVLSQKQEIQFNLINFKKILYKLLAWADFILIPFVFWVFRAIFLKPTGIYAAEGYREFSIYSVLLTPINLIVAFYQNFIGVLAGAFNPSLISIINTSIFFIILFILFYVLQKQKTVRLANINLIFYIGLYLFIAGAFAYVMIGLTPSFAGFNSRHQILLRFGAALLFFYFISLIIQKNIQSLVVASIISLFIVFTISSQLQYQKSWFKQMSLEKAFAQEKLLIEGVNFVVIDHTIEYNEHNTGYEFYCYTGILKKTFGTQTRFAIDSGELSTIENYSPQTFINIASMHMRNCRNITSFNYYVIINHGSIPLSNKQSLKMLYQYYLNKAQFDNSLNKILSLKVLPYNSEINQYLND